ncbi:thioredoxin fold domain-containing protein [Desulfurobacterium thermolithotrophum]|uniref:thioredoxin fold domain-containing protein n=1 Tax=Desulfurobacterium thermolithotrophum TaxID=64160 RepID=UPI0013D6B54A|nr:thioredoxin fold domain-containing protein [Desulfurobacterium thermolithotrophum]
MRFLTAFLALSFFCSCSAAQEKELKSEKKEIQKEEATIKAILKPLATKGIEVKEIKELKDSPVEGLRTFEVTLIDKRNNRVIKKYLWLSKDDKYLVLDLFELKQEGKNVVLSQVKLKQDLSWLKKIEEELNKENIPHILGNGKNKIYVVWDVYCPFCFNHFKKVAGEKLKELDLQIHLIPLPVHGEKSIKGFVYFTQMARKEGMKEAMANMFSKGEGDFLKFDNVFSKEVDENYNKIPKKEREELEKFYKKLQKELLSHNIHATPTIIYIPPTEKDKGYVFVGFKPFEEVLKMK